MGDVTTATFDPDYGPIDQQFYCGNGGQIILYNERFEIKKCRNCNHDTNWQHEPELFDEEMEEEET